MRKLLTLALLLLPFLGYSSTFDGTTMPFDSVVITPFPDQFFPLNGGERPSTIAVRYKTSAGVVYGDSNIFRVEFSNADGVFDDAHYPAKFVGSVKSSAVRGTITGIRIPDNVDYNPAVATKRFRIRLTSSHPAQVSFNSADIPGNNYTNYPQRTPTIYASTLRPLKKLYNRGDQVSFTIYRDPTVYVAQPTDYIRIQLSDSNSIFRGIGISTRIIDSIAPAFVGDSMVLSFAIPTDVAYHLRYRVRATLTSTPNMAGSISNGHDFSIVTGGQIANKEELTTQLVAYPMPATQTLNWQAPSQAGKLVSAQLISMTGASYPVSNGEGNVRNLPRGTYALRLQTANGVYTSRVVLQ
jgi:hypothetical protein